MRPEHLRTLLEATRINPNIYGALLRQPRETAASLGLELSSNDTDALQNLAAGVRRTARVHDDLLVETGKQCIFAAILGALSPKRGRKSPKPRKAPKPPKPA
jgi:hypothetical protein